MNAAAPINGDPESRPEACALPAVAMTAPKSTVGPTAIQGSDPVAVCQRLIAALAERDADTALALLIDERVEALGDRAAVDGFAAAFDRFCAAYPGQIHVIEHETYDQWAVVIVLGDLRGHVRRGSFLLFDDAGRWRVARDHWVRISFSPAQEPAPESG